MLLTCLVLLAIAWGSFWLCIRLRTSDEILFILAVVNGVLCLILGTVLAPWPIKLIIVLFLLRFNGLYLQPMGQER